MTGGSPGRCDAGGAGRCVTSSPALVAGHRVRSIPAASMAASVVCRGRARDRRRAGRAPATSSGDSIGPPGVTSDRRGTLPPFECSEPSEDGRVSRIDPFGARAPLGAGPAGLLPAGRARRPDRPAPTRRSRSRSCSRTLLRHAGGGIVRPEDVETLAVLAARRSQPRPRSRSCHRASSSRTSPACPRSWTSRSCATPWRSWAATRHGQPARPGRPRHRPFRPGRPVRDARRVRLQRRARVRAQRRALPAAALGADGVPRPARRAARDRHRPPGQPRVPGHRRGRPRRRTATAAASPSPTPLVGTDSHTTMVNGLGVLGLRRRRDRGRGGPARPAALPADAAGRRRPPPWRAAAGLDRDRPGPRRDRDAARARRRRIVRRVRRRRAGRRCPLPTGPRSAT